jgi:hypothetical protein
VQLREFGDPANAAVLGSLEPIDEQRALPGLCAEEAEELRGVGRRDDLDLASAALLLDELREQVQPRRVDAVLELFDEVEPRRARVQHGVPSRIVRVRFRRFVPH